MPAQHDQLVLQIGAGDFGDGVVGHQILVLELDLELNGDLEVFAGLAHADEPVVMLLREHNLRHDLGCVFGVHAWSTLSPPAAASADRGGAGDARRLHKECAAVTLVAWLDEHGDAFAREEQELLPLEFHLG